MVNWPLILRLISFVISYNLALSLLDLSDLLLAFMTNVPRLWALTLPMPQNVAWHHQLPMSISASDTTNNKIVIVIVVS